MRRLATSPWPRAGGDQGNRSRTSVSGPTEGRLLRRIPLQGALPDRQGRAPRIAGGAVAPDGSLRVMYRGMLYALDPEGRALWCRSLLEDELLRAGLESEEEEEDNAQEDVRYYHSLPCVLNTGEVLVTLTRTAFLLDAHGALIARSPEFSADDSGPAPNVDLAGTPLLTANTGDVYRWEGDQLVELGYFGYDIVPVALFRDNSFVVAGYAGKGLCRVRQDGTILWRSELAEADLLPTVHDTQHAAAGSINDGGSLIVTPEGAVYGSYDQAAVFAAYPDGGWMALSKTSVARLSPTAKVQWQHTIDADLRWGSYQPIVDSRGWSYVPDGDAIVAFDAAGQRVYQLSLGTQPGPLLPISAGVFGTVVGEELLFCG